MATIRAGDLEVWYEARGAGPPLVCLHGATSSGEADFRAQLPSLTTAFRVFLPDARGHGRTREDPGAGFHAGGLVDDLEHLLDALGLATVHLLGFSMGGHTALAFAARWPDRVRTLVIAGFSPEREPRASIVRKVLDPERIERTDPAWAARLAQRHDPGRDAGSWRRLLPAIADDVATQPLLTARALRSITAPTLVVSGDRDPFVPVGQAWQLSRQVVDGRLLVAPGCGHEVLSEGPAVVNEALAGFYRSTETMAVARAAPHPEVSA
jgi:pimeloyl-ACP methyl ester carboxylesterase